MALMAGSVRRTRNILGLGGLALGGGDIIKRIRTVTVAVDPASIAATTKAGTAVAVTGVAVGDIVIAVPPTALEDDLIPAGEVVTATDQVTFYLYNASAGAVDGVSRNWTLLHIDLT